MKVGDIFVCAETQKTVTVQRDGCSYNYATCRDGTFLSDEGVDLREKRELLDRSKPFYCYLSSDLKTVTGWKGNVLGRVLYTNRCGHLWTREPFYSFRVTDVFGKEWYGRGSPGVRIGIRPVKD